MKTPSSACANAVPRNRIVEPVRTVPPAPQPAAHASVVIVEALDTAIGTGAGAVPERPRAPTGTPRPGRRLSADCDPTETVPLKETPGNQPGDGGNILGQVAAHNPLQPTREPRTAPDPL